MYKEIKQSPKTEIYLTSFIDSKSRSHLAQLRIGILPLMIETGRFRGTPLAERICICCSTNSVESEYHFLFECELYDDERRSWYQNMNFDLPTLNNLSMVERMSIVFCKPKLTAKYITVLMEKRRAKLYNN